MEEKIIISDKKHFENVKDEIMSGGSDNVYFIVDFDKTLTKAFSDTGEKIASVISILRDYDYLTPEYSRKAKELFNKYHPFEIDPSLLDEARAEKMEEWWNAHFQLIINSGLRKDHLQRVVDSNIVKLRDGVVELLNFLHQKSIPVLIFSANGIGNTIGMMLEKEGVLFDNIHILTNIFNFDEEGNAINLSGPPIHIANKDETILRAYPLIKERVINRKNVILVGDGLDDLKMSEGFDHSQILKIGFLNYNVDELLERYKKEFDLVLTNDASFDQINKLVMEIV